MRAELARVKTWLRPQPTPELNPAKLSWDLLSSCCDAPVIQCHEPQPDLFPVSCTKCGGELGAPGREDLDPREPSPYAQWGCGGSHRGDGSPGCPRERHHHHDERCFPPAFIQAEQARAPFGPTA